MQSAACDLMYDAFPIVVSSDWQHSAHSFVPGVAGKPFSQFLTFAGHSDALGASPSPSPALALGGMKTLRAALRVWRALRALRSFACFQSFSARKLRDLSVNETQFQSFAASGPPKNSKLLSKTRLLVRSDIGY
eukprot:1315392-Prymnesium_polylepis.1